ncbi:MAG: hypothetical protein DDT19_03015 [Syntrophomonadaceae bacterium]|nr:hypothetical protein [Bacillota bacterium]
MKVAPSWGVVITIGILPAAPDTVEVIVTTVGVAAAMVAMAFGLTCPAILSLILSAITAGATGAVAVAVIVAVV